jgi:hypothetical protein
MHRQPLQRRDNTRARNVLTAAGMVALVSVGGCLDFGFTGLDWNDGGCTMNCTVPPWVAPYSAYILRGDTVRFLACSDYTKPCNVNDTGHVISKWTVPDSSVVALTNGTSAVLVPAATSVLVRGIAPGRTNVTVTFSTGSTNTYLPTMSVRVADSSEIKSVELPMYASSDTVRVGLVRMFGVQLRDVGGVTFRGSPAVVSSDTAILKVATKAGLYGTLEGVATGVKPGKASITATFLGITATRELTVVP